MRGNSVCTSHKLQVLFWEYFQMRVSNKANWRSHLKGIFSWANSDHLCLVCMPNVCRVCGWSISIGGLTKMFCNNKNGKQIIAISHENRAKNWEKENPATTIMKKERLIRCWICLSKAWNFYWKRSEQKVSDTVFEATELDCSKVI